LKKEGVTVIRTDNPVQDAEMHFAALERKLHDLPVCENCGKAIQQESAIYYNDQWCCKECESDFWNDIRSDFLATVEVV